VVNIIKNKHIKVKLMIFFIFIASSFILFLYTFDKIASPTIAVVGDAQMRAKSIEIINRAIIDEYSKEFKYNEVIQTEKDKDGNIVMLSADTLKMNKIACDVSLKAQEDLSKLGSIGIKIPMGYIFRNNILAGFGPNITIRMQPYGSIETKYSSTFDSAGINQTRHKIYVELTTTIRVILPLKIDNLEIKNEVPIAETIIIGKIPQTNMSLDLNNAGYKTSTADNK